MIYGNANDVITECPRCDESIDKHRFSIIRSADAERLVKDLQGKLDGVAKQTAIHGFDPARNTCMAGAAVATINDGVYKYVAISGGDTAILNHIGSLGKDVTVVKGGTALPLSTIKGKSIARVQPAPRERDRDYPIGACAAQKLLMAVFKQADKSGGRDKITRVSLAEVLWNDPTNSGHNRDWSTGSIVCSCDTCKRVVPMMLCDKEA
jgi:hypothetical protein